MDRSDLRLAIVALEARIRRLEPALDVFAADPVDGPRLRAVAAGFRGMANGFAPIQFAADELDRIAQLGAGVLRLPAEEQLGAAVEILHKLHREPAVNRQIRRADAARAERQERRLKKSDRLQRIAAASSETRH